MCQYDWTTGGPDDGNKGILKRYPEIGDRPKMVLSSPPEGSTEPLKRFYGTRIGSIEPPFEPQKRSIEPFWEGLQNYRQGSKLTVQGLASVDYLKLFSGLTEIRDFRIIFGVW